MSSPPFSASNTLANTVRIVIDSTPQYCRDLVTARIRYSAKPITSQIDPWSGRIQPPKRAIGGGIWHEHRCENGMSRYSRRLLIVGLCLAFLAIACCVGAIAPKYRYSHRYHRILNKLQALQEQRPEGVDAQSWNECTAWASIGFANICFSKPHTSYEAMSRFEDQLDEKLKEKVDLATIAWIGDRLAETGPHGWAVHAKMETTVGS